MDNTQWAQAQEWERDWHGNCANSFHEEQKQYVYAQRMGLDEFKVIDPAGSADGKYTGITVAGTAGEALVFGDVIVLDVTAGKWFKGSVSAAAGADGRNIYIGNNSTSFTSGWDGKMYLLRVWNRILSNSEVYDLYIDPNHIYKRPYIYGKAAAVIPSVFRPRVMFY